MTVDPPAWQQPWMPPIQPAQPKPSRARWILAAALGLALAAVAAYFLYTTVLTFTVTGTWTQPGECPTNQRQIDIDNNTGVLLATGWTTTATPTYNYHCIYDINVPGVPAHEAGYIIKLAGRSSIPLSKDQASQLNLVQPEAIH